MAWAPSKATRLDCALAMAPSTSIDRIKAFFMGYSVCESALRAMTHRLVSSKARPRATGSGAFRRACEDQGELEAWNIGLRQLDFKADLVRSLAVHNQRGSITLK